MPSAIQIFVSVYIPQLFHLQSSFLINLACRGAFFSSYHSRFACQDDACQNLYGSFCDKADLHLRESVKSGQNTESVRQSGRITMVGEKY